jgi:Ca2+-binding EF-hand superfamily protein
MHACAYIHIYIHTYIHTYIHSEDGSGKLDPSELKEALRGMGARFTRHTHTHTHIHTYVRTYIQRTDQVSLIQQSSKRPFGAWALVLPDTHTHTHIHTYIRTYIHPEDGSGKLDPTELKEALRGMGARFSDEQMDSVLTFMDISKDGLIDMGEFQTAVEMAEV